MGRLWRLLRHRAFDERDARRALSAQALQRIEQRIADSERRHSGEIRVCVEAGLPLSYLWRDAAARERAVALFGKLRVWDTEQNNGVLIYLLLAERQIEIVADRALARLAPPGHWEALVENMRAAFHEGQFEAGLLQAIDATHDLLVRHFALAPGAADRNELPDQPVILR